MWVPPRTKKDAEEVNKNAGTFSKFLFIVGVIITIFGALQDEESAKLITLGIVFVFLSPIPRFIQWFEFHNAAQIEREDINLKKEVIGEKEYQKGPELVVGAYEFYTNCILNTDDPTFVYEYKLISGPINIAASLVGTKVSFYYKKTKHFLIFIGLSEGESVVLKEKLESIAAKNE